jgi:hypothetical protein
MNITPVHLGRYEVLMAKLLTNVPMSQAELIEYRRLADKWVLLFNAKRRGEDLTAAEQAFMKLKTRDIRARSAMARPEPEGPYV